jgi:hypothetical protein
MDLNSPIVDSYSATNFDYQLDRNLTTGSRKAIDYTFDWTPEPVQSWMTDASCVGLDPELFAFDHADHKKLKKALNVCTGCPVRASCLETASPVDLKFTVRGGEIPKLFRAELCKRGHQNWGHRNSSQGGGERFCKTCKNEREKELRRGKMSG